MPRLSTIRLVVLLGILAAIFVKEGLGLDILPASSGFSSVGGGRFTLCSTGNQAQCVVDGDTIHYAGLKIRLEGIDRSAAKGFAGAGHVDGNSGY